MDGGGGNRAEAERWLYTANKLLSARDLHGARSFAIRARESDPTFDASELLLTVIDTLLAGETRINDQHRDWYGILQILRYTTNIDHIAAQYRRLALLLDPNRNPFAFAAHAFSLIHDAWSVLSSPAKKAMYDADLRLLTSTPPPPPQHQHQQHHNNAPTLQQPQPQSTQRRNPKSKDGAASDPNRQNRSSADASQHNRTTAAASSEAAAESSFWTSCPYCYVLYEYPKVYEDCALRCQSCRRGFHAVVIRSPPLNGKDSSFGSWGFLPLGFSGDSKDINGFSSNWNPFSALFPCPLKGSNMRKASWTYYDDEAAAAFVELSDPSEEDSDDEDWRSGGKKVRKRSRVLRRRDSGDGDGGDGGGGGSGVVRRRGRPSKGSQGGGGGGSGAGAAGGGGGGSGAVRRRGRPRKGSQGGGGGAEHGAVDGGGGGAGAVGASGVRPESSKKAALGASRRRGAGNLDLNVEFSNDVEEPSRRGGIREGHAAGNTEDNIEGNGFFEGLDEFLSSLPILNVVGDDKVKGH